METHQDHLVDRWQIIELLNAYAYHFDRNEPVEVGELFDTEAVVDYGPELGPISKGVLVDTITVSLQDVFSATSHHISNISVEFDADDSARSIAYVFAWHSYRDGSPDGFLWGQYHTRLRRIGPGWKFTHMTLKVAGTTDFHRARMHSIGRKLPG